MIERSIAATTHGRYLVVPPAGAAPAGLLVGFHGYAEGAESQLERLRAIPGAERWGLVAIQGLHRFYQRRTNEVIASWMTRQDRDLAIADNLAYVEGVIDAVSREIAPLTRARHGWCCAAFSQGVAMAFSRRDRDPPGRRRHRCRRRRAAGDRPRLARSHSHRRSCAAARATSGIRMRNSSTTSHACASPACDGAPAGVRRRSRVVGSRSGNGRGVSSGSPGAGRRATSGRPSRPTRERWPSSDGNSASAKTPPTEAREAFVARCATGCRCELTRGAWRAWVAAQDGRIVGQIWLQVLSKLPNPADELESHAYISNVYVTPSARGGVGTRLLQTAIDWTCSNRCRSRRALADGAEPHDVRTARLPSQTTTCSNSFRLRPHPLDHRALNVVVHRGLGGRILAGELEGVVAAGDRVDRRRRSDASTTGASSAGVPKASRVPCTNSIGRPTAGRCLSRRSVGRPGGWSG